MLKKAIAMLLLACMLMSPALAAVSMTLPKSLKTIGEEAFAGTSAAEKIVVPEVTLEIGSRAFAGSGAGEIHLPISLTSIADDAFEDCSAVLYVQKDSYAHLWCNQHGMNYVVLGEAAAPDYYLEGMQLSEDKASVSIRATAKEACTLKVDVLSNDGKSVLQSANADVAAESAYAPVEAEFADALSGYFILRAVLVDAKGNELCEAVTNRRYTSAYAEFENQSAEDFPEERRVTFGESGYAVLADGVMKLDVSATQSSGKYTFTTGQSLKKGDVIRILVSGEEKLLKVGSVSKNANGSVTVTEDANTYLSDFYDVINIDADLRGSEVSRGENIDEDKQVFSKDKSISVGAAELSLHAEMSIHLKFIYNKEKFGADYFDIQLTADTAGTVGVFLGGEIDTWKSDNAPAVQIYNSVVIIPGLSAPAFLNVSIPVNLYAKAGGNMEFGFSNSYGYYYNPDDKFTKTESGNSHAEVELQGEFTVMAGPEISLTTSLFGLVSARIGGQFGAKVTGVVETPSYGGSTAPTGDKVHACQGCIDGDLYASADLRGTLLYKLTEEVSGTLLDIKIAAYESEKLGDCYFSFKNDPESIYKGEKSFGLSECQNFRYRITGETIGMDGKEKSGVPVTFSGSTIETKTGKSPHKIYLYPGKYHALAAFTSGDVERDFTVNASSFGLVLEEKETIIEGYVRDAETSKPISGAKVVLVKPDGGTKTSTTNAEGYYRFDMLPGGTYTIKYSAASYKSDSYENMTFAAGTMNQLNMALVSDLILIEGYVRDAETNKPISGASVVVKKPDGSTKTTATNAEGYYCFDKLPSGTYTVTYSAAGYKSDSYDNMTFEAGSKIQLNKALVSNLLIDELVVKKVIGYMGEDLIQRLKDADILLSFDFDYYVPSGEDEDYENGQLQIMVELRSAVKSTWPEFTVDIDTFNDAYQAILDADVFGMTAEETAELKQYAYEPNSYGNCYADENLESGIRMHMNATPSYEAIVYVTHPYLKTTSNRVAWYSSWRFDEMSHASSGRPK